MNKLINTINEILYKEYENTNLNPKIEYITGFFDSEISKHKEYHMAIYLEFTRDENQIIYALIKSSYKYSNSEQFIPSNLEENFYKLFVSNLLFSIEPLRIARILSNGEIEPTLIISTNE
jgi:hypothetical protein